MITYLVAAGIAIILTPLFQYLSKCHNINPIVSVIWAAICRFVVGLSFAFITASSINISSEYVASTKKLTSIISLLLGPFCVSSMIQYADYKLMYYVHCVEGITRGPFQQSSM